MNQNKRKSSAVCLSPTLSSDYEACLGIFNDYSNADSEIGMNKISANKKGKQTSASKKGKLDGYSEGSSLLSVSTNTAGTHNSKPIISVRKASKDLKSFMVPITPESASTARKAAHEIFDLYEDLQQATSCTSDHPTTNSRTSIVEECDSFEEEESIVEDEEVKMKSMQRKLGKENIPPRRHLPTTPENQTSTPHTANQVVAETFECDFYVSVNNGIPEKKFVLISGNRLLFFDDKDQVSDASEGLYDYMTINSDTNIYMSRSDQIGISDSSNSVVLHHRDEELLQRWYHVIIKSAFAPVVPLRNLHVRRGSENHSLTTFFTKLFIRRPSNPLH